MSSVKLNEGNYYMMKDGALQQVDSVAVAPESNGLTIPATIHKSVVVVENFSVPIVTPGAIATSLYQDKAKEPIKFNDKDTYKINSITSSNFRLRTIGVIKESIIIAFNSILDAQQELLYDKDENNINYREDIIKPRKSSDKFNDINVLNTMLSMIDGTHSFYLDMHNIMNLLYTTNDVRIAADCACGIAMACYNIGLNFVDTRTDLKQLEIFALSLTELLMRIFPELISEASNFYNKAYVKPENKNRFDDSDFY